MKKYLFTLLFLALVAGCSAGAASPNGGQTPETRAVPPANDDGGGAVDVDLTVLSGTMVYAEVYNIMANPDDYMGKTIKMSGPYSVSYYDGTGLYYHYVVIEDATACCQQGLEFVWNGNHDYPDDYPAENTKIEVAGVFGSYEELGQIYYYLGVDAISVL